LILILRGAPATVDDEFDAVDGGTSCSPADGSEQISVEVAYGRNLVVKNGRAVGDGAVNLAKRTTGLAAKTTVLSATDLDGR
jgi:hypothetical protein